MTTGESPSLRDYAAKTRDGGVAGRVSDALGDTASGLLNLSFVAAPFAPFAKLLKYDLAGEAAKWDAAKDILFRQGTSGLVAALPPELTSTIDGFLEAVQRAFVEIVKRVSGADLAHADVGAAMLSPQVLSAQQAASGAQLQGAVGTALASAIANGGGDLPPVADIARAVAAGVQASTMTGDALVGDAAQAIGRTLSSAVGMTSKPTDPKTVSFDVASRIHASVFHMALKHHQSINPGTSEDDTLRYAETVAHRISGLTAAECTAGKRDDRPHEGGLIATLDAQLAAPKGDRTPVTIALAETLTPAATPPMAPDAIDPAKGK